MKLLKTELWDDPITKAYRRVSEQVRGQVLQQVIEQVFWLVRDQVEGEIL